MVAYQNMNTKLRPQEFSFADLLFHRLGNKCKIWTPQKLPAIGTVNLRTVLHYLHLRKRIRMQNNAKSIQAIILFG